MERRERKATVRIGLILAAGTSERLGVAKQNVKFLGKPLLACIQEKMVGVCDVVYTACRDGNAGETHPIRVLSQGIGETLERSISEILSRHKEEPFQLLLTLVDQPLLTVQHLENLFQKQLETQNHEVVVTHYRGN